MFELMLNVQVKSNVHVGTLPPFYGTFTQNVEVMTSNKCFKYNHTSKPHMLILLDLNRFIPEQLTSNQIVSQRRKNFALGLKRAVAHIPTRPL